jgi:hypothetical protein
MGVSEHSLVIVGPQGARTIAPEPARRGRPRSAEPGVSVKTWLRQSEYDRLIKAAAVRREPVSSLVRSLLMTRLP